MDISTLFQDEINFVDPAKTLTFVVNPATHGQFEFSYSGLTVTGGTELACEYGASELLEAMGFRWYCSAPWGTVRPVSIPTGLTRAKGQFWMPVNTMFLVYGHSWVNSVPASTTGLGQTLQSRVDLNAGQFRFAKLNGFQQGAYPAGHRWGAIIMNHLAWFAARPHLLKGGLATLPAPYGTSTRDDANACHFDLEPGHLTTAQYDELVHLCAADLLNVGRTVTDPRSQIEITWTDWKRTHMDPTDGDQNLSDWVYPFTKAVATKMRAGTAAIDNIAAQVGEPTCQIGIYAYAGHRRPPFEPASATPPGSYKPGVYTQVALAFNQTGYTYQELFDLHGARSDALLIREYWDTQAWSQGRPFINARMKPLTFESYDDFIASGVIGLNTEFAANWLANIVGTRYGMRKCKTGTGTWQNALDDIMSKLFNDDPAVRELYEDWWGSPRMKYNRYNLRRSFDIIDGMVDGWYKTLFEQYVTIIKKQMYLPPKILKANNTSWPAPMPGDPFPAAFASYVGNIVAMRMDEVIHSYAQCRQDANSKVATDYPDLWMFRLNNDVGTREINPIPGFPTYTTNPEWLVNPVKPTHDEFVAAREVLTTDTPHDVDMDSEDLVLVRGVVPAVQNFNPTTNASHRDATAFNIRNVASFAYVGPGTVIFTKLESGQPTGESTPQSYGPGLHFIDSPGGYIWVTWIGGELFMDTFGGMYKDPGGGGAHWFYVPQRHAGNVSIECNPRWTFYDESGRLDVGLTTDASNLGPGQIQVDNNNTRGTINNMNCNRWLSAKPTIALLPRVIANEDFPNRAKVDVI